MSDIEAKIKKASHLHTKDSFWVPVARYYIEIKEPKRILRGGEI